jgi:hypothetical protein
MEETRKKIEAFVTEHKRPREGYVIMQHGRPWAWTRDIKKHDASKVTPGNVAYAIENPKDQWEALGGNDEDGAELWAPLPQ